MPAYTVYKTSTGEVLSSGFVPDEAWLENTAGPDESIYMGSARFDQKIINGEPVDDESLKLNQLKDAVRYQLELARQAKSTEPITYEGVKLDADAKSQGNIKDKLDELDRRFARGQGMPTELLVWRDFDDQMHSFVTMDEYRDWLSMALIAIAERSTRLYVWMWEKKAQLDSCTTLSELQALDLSLSVTIPSSCLL